MYPYKKCCRFYPQNSNLGPKLQSFERLANVSFVFATSGAIAASRCEAALYHCSLRFSDEQSLQGTVYRRNLCRNTALLYEDTTAGTV